MQPVCTQQHSPPQPPTNSQPKLWIFMNHYDCLISESFTQFPLNPSGWVNRDGLSCPQQLLDPVSVKARSVSTSQPPMTERTQQKSVLRTLNFPSVVSYSPGLGSKGKQSRCLFSRANKQVLWIQRFIAKCSISPCLGGKVVLARAEARFQVVRTGTVFSMWHQEVRWAS